MPHLSRTLLLACVLVLLGGCGGSFQWTAQERSSADMARGGELYRTYCGACHTAQVHWRDQRMVKSWEDLRYQVVRWQRSEGQNWSREEIDDVAAYLNTVFYSLPCPLAGCNGSKASAEHTQQARAQRAMP
jgi:mono/diheme cytochrome c family protein